MNFNQVTDIATFSKLQFEFNLRFRHENKIQSKSKHAFLCVFILTVINITNVTLRMCCYKGLIITLHGHDQMADNYTSTNTRSVQLVKRINLSDTSRRIYCIDGSLVQRDPNCAESVDAQGDWDCYPWIRHRLRIGH